MTDRTHPDSGRTTGGIVDMLHARIAELEAELAAIGAGGVEPLRSRTSGSTPPAAPQVEEDAASQVEHLDVENHRLRRAMQKIMARLAYLLDEDQFGNIESIVTEAGVEPPEPAAQAAPAVPLLAADHKGIRVDYTGLLGQCQRALRHTEPVLAEMLRQLQGHLTALGQRWYAGDTAVVDEILQLYCIEDDARAALSGESNAL